MKNQIGGEMSTFPKSEIIDALDINSENNVRLKVTMRKGARIASVPLKNLKKLARLYWKYENGWLMLIGH